eukprot:g1032.t1
MTENKKLKDELRQMRRNYLNLATENKQLKIRLQDLYNGKRSNEETSLQKWSSFGKLRYKSAFEEESQLRKVSEERVAELEDLVENLALRLEEEENARRDAQEKLTRLSHSVQSFVGNVSWLGRIKSRPQQNGYSNGYAH